MAHLLASGIPLLTSLDLLQEQRLITRRFYQRLTQLLSSGFSLSSSLEKLSFPSLFISFIRAAEEHGDYAQAFQQCERYYGARARWTRELGKSLMYPLLVLMLAGLAFSFLLSVVLPRFAELYQTMGIPLPRLTQWLFSLHASALIWAPKVAGWLLLFIAIGGLIRFAPRWVRAWLSQGLFLLPLLGSLCKHQLTHYVSIQLGSLLRAGVPLITALQTLRAMTPWSILSRSLRKMEAHLLAGTSLSEAIQKSGPRLFSTTLVKLVALGEESGKLDEILFHVAQGTELVLKNRLDRLTRSIEPLFIFMLGLVIAMIVIAMFLPLLHIVHSL